MRYFCLAMLVLVVTACGSGYVPEDQTEKRWGIFSQDIYVEFTEQDATVRRIFLAWQMADSDQLKQQFARQLWEMENVPKGVWIRDRANSVGDICFAVMGRSLTEAEVVTANWPCCCPNE